MILNIHRTLFLGIGFSILSYIESTAYAYTQRSPITSVGHELITVYGARHAGGMWAEPHTNQITGPSASCRLCDQYSTKNHHTWSVVMGQRWLDIAGYSVLDMKCLNATAQDSDYAQYNHALRRRCDVGLDGLKSAHHGIVERIREHFMRAVRMGDNTVWFRDGGATVLRFKAIASSFHLGMALHPFQDSFSEEHTIRSSDFRRIIDIKSYVHTQGAPEHAHHENKADRNKFTWLGVQPNPNNGDYAFKTMTSNAESNLKPSAHAAVEASADLMRAFQAARLAPNRANEFFNQVMTKWMHLDLNAHRSRAPMEPIDRPSSNKVRDLVAGGISAAATALCKPEGGTENQRIQCLNQASREPTYSEYPRLCWPQHTCQEDAWGHSVDASKKAFVAFGNAMKDVGHFFADIFQTIGDSIKHGFHSFNHCYNESGQYGSRSGSAAFNKANQRANKFWSELGSALDSLSVDERKRAVDEKWIQLRGELLRQTDSVREKQCNRVRNWFTKGSSKDKGQNHCRETFNGSIAQLGAQLDSMHHNQIHKPVRPVARSRSGGDSNNNMPIEHDVHIDSGMHESQELKHDSHPLSTPPKPILSSSR